MKRVLILSSNRQDGAKPSYLSDADFLGQLEKTLHTKVQVSLATLPELVFQIKKRPRVWHPVLGNIENFDAVVIRKVGKYVELAIALAHYLKAKNVQFTDEYLLTSGGGKLACAFIRAIDGLPVPETYVGPAHVLLENRLINFPCVLKADLGHAGKDNFLIHSAKEYQEISEKYHDRVMVAQGFIPNTGDYRVLVLNNKPKMVIFRQRTSEKSHLNNTSKGARAELIKLSNMSKDVLEIAKKAAKLEKLQVAGVDLMIDQTTGKPYIIEVNRAPQIPSGTFTTEKIEEYAYFLENLVQSGIKKAPTKIGRVENLTFKTFKDLVVPARIDTGAKTSAISAQVELAADGRLKVKFLVGTKNELYYFDTFERARVASSNGQVEERYKIKLKVTLAGRTVNTTFSLTDRTSQAYPVLIGRNFLRNKFIVDVSGGSPDFKKEKQRTKQLQEGLSK